MLGREPGFSARATSALKRSSLQPLLLFLVLWFCFTRSCYVTQAVLPRTGITVGCHHAQSSSLLQTVFVLLEHLIHVTAKPRGYSEDSVVRWMEMARAGSGRTHNGPGAFRRLNRVAWLKST